MLLIAIFPVDSCYSKRTYICAYLMEFIKLKMFHNKLAKQV